MLTILVSALLRWALLPRLSGGRWPVYGQIYLRRWLTNQIQESSLSVLHGLYASIYAGTGTACWAPRSALAPRSRPPWASCRTC